MAKKKRPKKKQVKKKQGKKKARPPLSAPTLVRMGVQMAAARLNHQAMLSEVNSKAPGMRRLIGRLKLAIKESKLNETVLTNYGEKFYPDMKWPRTVAHWRSDLCRTH